jgi:alpha-galactosidase
MFNDVETWLSDHFAPKVLPPFSFTYTDKLSEQFIRDWEFSHKKKLLDNARIEHTFKYEDLKTKLQVNCECIMFKDFPAIEWVVKFKNNAKDDTPIIEDIHALDTTFINNTTSKFVLHRALGSNATRKDFAPVDELINHVLYYAPVGGRSSSTTSLPFFNIEAVGEGGVMVGIGWSGQWATSFAKYEESSLHIRAGMELTHLKLHPGEEIRTPRIMLLFWQGDDYIQGHNLLRRFILAYHWPKKAGKPAILPFSCNSSHMHDEAEKATEQNQIDFASHFAKFGVEYLWIDAGWYDHKDGWWDGVGNWFVDSKRFPNGLRPVSDALKKMGMELLLWFEPERVYKGTWLDREHPEWITKLPRNSSGLLNLGNEDARRWLTDHISGMIEREGISIYRQDLNIDPLPYWKDADTPDRQGITEIHYIEGLYAFWDELLRRHPGLVIDNCAGGGRRIDLETVSRSIVLHRTDYEFNEPNGAQSHTYGISLYLPASSICCGYPEVYGFRSVINNGVRLEWNPYQPNIPQRWVLPFPVDLSEPFPLERARDLAEEFKRVRHLFFGDFYPLTPHSVTDDAWIAYQFHREDLRQGLVHAFRRPKSPIETITLKMRGLSPGVSYEVCFEDSGLKQTFTGKELGDGLDVTIKNPPGAALITYSAR